MLTTLFSNLLPKTSPFPIVPFSQNPLVQHLPHVSSAEFTHVAKWIADNLWYIESFLLSLQKNLSDKHKKHPLWRYGATVLAISVVGGLFTRIWYKRAAHRNQEAIEHLIMKTYPLKPLEILQLRKSNYLNVNDVDNLRSSFLKKLAPNIPNNTTIEEEEEDGRRGGGAGGDGDEDGMGSGVSYGFDPMQVRLTLEELQVHFSSLFSRPLRDTFLLSEVFKRVKKDAEGKVGLCECIIILAMISIGKPSERQSLAFAAVDTDGDGVISLSELIAFVELITTIGWCYARHTYVRSFVFPPSYRRTDPKEMTTLLLKSVGVHINLNNTTSPHSKPSPMGYSLSTDHFLSSNSSLPLNDEPSIPFALFQRIPFNLV